MRPRRLDQHAARFAVALVCGLALARPAPANASPADADHLYRQQCAPCHGPTGRGDGPDAAILAHAPPDLGPRLAGASDQALVQRILDGRTTALPLNMDELRRRATDVESLVVYLPRLPATDWTTADSGREIYLARCQSCHGPYGTPIAPLPVGVQMPRDLSDPAVQRSLSDAAITRTIRQGHSGMPGLLPRMSPDEATQVAAAVRLLSPGYTSYSQYCAGCHGDHGIGNGSLGEGVPLPTVLFNRAYFARQDPEALRRNVWHMVDEHGSSMPHFRGAISETDARALVRWLRQTAVTPATPPSRR